MPDRLKPEVDAVVGSVRRGCSLALVGQLSSAQPTTVDGVLHEASAHPCSNIVSRWSGVGLSLTESLDLRRTVEIQIDIAGEASRVVVFVVR